MELGHRRRLQREIANSKRLAQDPAFVQPLYQSASPQSTPDDLSTLRQPRESRKKKSRRHPKPDLNAPEQPYSAYVMFSNHTREQVDVQNLSFTNLSKEVEKRWQALAFDEKETWSQRGAGSWEEYKTKMANYQKTDQYRDYQRYLADFKATQKSSTKRDATRQSHTAYGTEVSPFPPKQRHSGSPRDKQVVLSPKKPKTVVISSKRDEDSWTRRQTIRGQGRPKCDPCRQKKLDCDGRQPTCRYCESNQIECRYAKRGFNVQK